MIEKGWHRDLRVSWAKLIIHDNKIVVTERDCHLVCIEPKSGELIWDSKIGNPYGWLTSLDNKIFYLDQSGEVRIIDFKTGAIIEILKLDYPYLGYIIPFDKYLITGAWRGYTDLTCYILDSGIKKVWSRNTKSKELKSYSIPRVLNNHLIFLDNTSNTITKIDLENGSDCWSINLPPNIGSLDLDFTFQIDMDKIIVYSKDGVIYTLGEKAKSWDKVVTHSTKITTITPKVLQTQFLFQDSDGKICSYDKVTGVQNWTIKSNHGQCNLPAIELDSELTLLCLNMRRKMIIDKTGKLIFEFDSEKRYESDLYRIDNDLYYLSKSELKQLNILKNTK